MSSVPGGISRAAMTSITHRDCKEIEISVSLHSHSNAALSDLVFVVRHHNFDKTLALCGCSLVAGTASPPPPLPALLMHQRVCYVDV